jgi:hypothetical protein
MHRQEGIAMNQLARQPSDARVIYLGALLSGLAAAVRDTAAFMLIREAHGYFAPPRAFRHPVSKRARRFMRGGE